MKWKIGALIITLAVISSVYLYSYSNNAELTPEYNTTHPPDFSRKGDNPTNIDPNTCNDKAKLVIEQHNLSKIHSCNVEEIKYGLEKAYIVSILYGSGLDCPSGCIYFDDTDIVFGDNTIYPIKGRYFSNPDREISKFIWNKIKLPVRNIKDASTRELVNYNNGLAFKYIFFRYLNGDVYVFINQSPDKSIIEGNITPKGMTIQQAKDIAVKELQKKDYETDSRLIQDNYFIDKDCWNFRIRNNDYKYSVMVCLDNTTNVDCE